MSDTEEKYMEEICILKRYSKLLQDTVHIFKKDDKFYLRLISELYTNDRKKWPAVEAVPVDEYNKSWQEITAFTKIENVICYVFIEGDMRQIEPVIRMTEEERKAFLERNNITDTNAFVSLLCKYCKNVHYYNSSLIKENESAFSRCPFCGKKIKYTKVKKIDLRGWKLIN